MFFEKASLQQNKSRFDQAFARLIDNIESIIGSIDYTRRRSCAVCIDGIRRQDRVKYHVGELLAILQYEKFDTYERPANKIPSWLESSISQLSRYAVTSSSGNTLSLDS